MDGKEVFLRSTIISLSVFRLSLDFELIFQSFANLHIALFIWLIMKLCTSVVVYVAFHYWAHYRLRYAKNLRAFHSSRVSLFDRFSHPLELYDLIWLSIYILYLFAFLFFPCREIVKHQLPVASSLIVLLEQV